MEELRRSTPEQIEGGKSIYLAQCMACHGMEGKGDGPAAAALNPKPRDFTSGHWKQGGSPAQVFHTISKGVPGSPMASFESLSLEDRWKLTHFIRSISPNTPDDTEETLELIGLQKGGTSVSKQVESLPEIPVEFVIERMGEEK